jgi:hypothetical protein
MLLWVISPNWIFILDDNEEEVGPLEGGEGEGRASAAIFERG